MDKPKLFVCNKIIKYFLTTEGKFQEIRNKITDANDELVIQGLFILLISFFENMMSDALSYFLQQFPEKIPKEKYRIDKKLVIESLYPKNIISNIAEQEISELTYKSIKEFLEKFVDYLALEITFDDKQLNTLNEIKETRNLLLHNNLRVNTTYLLKTGDFAREKVENVKLKLDAEYVKTAIAVLAGFLNDIRKSIIRKYQQYTSIKAAEELWYFMFHSAVMIFEDYWILDKEQDKIAGLKKCKYERGLAASEASLLSLWRTLFTGDTEIKNFDFYHLDVHNRSKVNLLFELASDYWFWSGEYA